MTPKVLEAAACGNVLKSTPQVTLHVHMATCCLNPHQSVNRSILDFYNYWLSVNINQQVV